MSQISNLYSLNASKGQESSNQAGAKDKKQLIKGRAVKRLEDEHTLGVLSHILKFAGYEKAKRVCKAWEQASLRNEQAFLKKIQEGKKGYQIFVPYLNNIQGKSYQEVIRFFHELGSLWKGHKDYFKNVVKINQSQANLHVLRDLIQWHQDQNLLAFAKGLKNQDSLNSLKWLIEDDLKDAAKVREALKQHSNKLANHAFLGLPECGLKELPKEIALFADLRLINLAHNQLIQASGVSQYTQLITLILAGNQLTQVSYISQCKQLKTLELSHNQLKQAFDMSQCTQLVRVDLSHNQLTETPDVSKCTQLVRVDLSHNQLTEAPDVSKCTQLQWLDLFHNELTGMLDVSKCTQLKRLDLSHNQVKQVSDMSQCTQLQWFDLSHNQVKQVSDMSQCTQLQWLDLSHNQLKQAPGVSKCKQLQELYLSHNQLKQAPNVSQCTQLQKLDLSHNQLKQAPDVSTCAQLKWLDLFNNRILIIELANR